MDGYALNDIARGGVENMALDQRLLETAAEQKCVMLRVYRWSEPTLSLGYFQPYAERLSQPPSSQLEVVRRATGGGAIVHHFDWTYCIAVPDTWVVQGEQQSKPAKNKIGASQSLYDCLHDAVVGWLSSLGIRAQKWSPSCAVESAGPAVRATRAFLCFERRSCGDVVWEQEKVLGSAQRRIPGAVLQHGSLLLARSPYAPRLSGLAGALDGMVGHKPANQASEGFLKHLAQAVQTASGVTMRDLKSLSESPIDWNWPIATNFAETNWTKRL